MASFDLSQKGEMLPQDWKKFGMNLVMFTAPILATFFGLLAQGVSIEKAWPVALLALYGAIADFLTKLNSVTTYKK